MAGATQEPRVGTGAPRTWLHDANLRRLGIAVAGLVAFLVLYLLLRIAGYVDLPLLQRILYPMFVNAFLNVLTIFVVSSVLSVAAGVLVALGRISRTPFTRWVATAYVGFFRGTPLLFQIVVLYFGIPTLWPPGRFPIPNFEVPAAILSLTLNHAAYVGEALRGGIDAVPKGQMEAARSLGMGYAQAMREVVLPQGWRNALAAVGNDQIILVKDTSLLTVISVPELIYAFLNVNAATFEPWTPLVLVAIAYLVLTLPLGWFVRWLEARSQWGRTHA